MSLRVLERYLWALSVIHIISLQANDYGVSHEVMYYGTSKETCRNEIELGMEIPTIEYQASNIPTEKGNYACCHKGSTDKDLHRIRRNQCRHPGPAIGY